MLPLPACSRFAMVECLRLGQTLCSFEASEVRGTIYGPQIVRSCRNSQKDCRGNCAACPKQRFGLLMGQLESAPMPRKDMLSGGHGVSFQMPQSMHRDTQGQYPV